MFEMMPIIDSRNRFDNALTKLIEATFEAVDDKSDANIFKVMILASKLGEALLDHEENVIRNAREYLLYKDTIENFIANVRKDAKEHARAKAEKVIGE